MEGTEIFFLLAFIGCLVALGIQLLSVFSMGKRFELQYKILLFVGFIVCYGVSFLVYLTAFDNLTLMLLARLNSIFLVASIILFGIDLMFEWGLFTNSTRQRAS